MPSIGIFHTKAELYKLHQHFLHPSAKKHFKLFRRAKTKKAIPETFPTFKQVCKRFDLCQRTQNAPDRYRVSLDAQNACSSERLFMEIIYIHEKPVLRVVDEETHSSAATFLPNASIMNIWHTNLFNWAPIYTILRSRMLVEHEGAFGFLFIYIAAPSKVEVDRSSIEARSSLGLGERYQQPIRQTYRKIMA